jgi:hypothetical protein
MDYRFFLTDRKTGERQEISEPVKFDGFTPVVKRGSYYGMMPDQSDNDIEFDRAAGYAFLKAAYEKYGVDAEIDFLCEYTCDGRVWEEYYSGQIDFAALYEERHQNWCRVATSVMANDIRITFLEKREDEIDLDSLVSRGGATLKKYNNLGREISLPAKTIKITSEAAQEYADGEELGQTILLYRTGQSGAPSCEYPVPFIMHEHKSILHFRLNSAEYTEIGTVNEGVCVSQPLNNDPPQPIIQVDNPDIKISGAVLEINISGKLSRDSRMDWIEANNIRITINEDIYNIDGDFSASCATEMEFNFSREVTLPKVEGDIDIKMDLRTVMDINTTDELTLTIHSGSYVRLTANSQYPATPAKTYLIHESLSRIAENLTDGKLTVKSDFYGRTDSEVHRTDIDGNAGLRAITNGYLIRRAVMTDGTTPKMFVSWKKLFESLQAIDNVGFCFEEGGIIRVEPVEYFYKDDIVMTCNGINEHTVKFDADSNIRTVKTGYEEWLSDEYNSIDGFHTTREYHTQVEKSIHAKEYFSELIADGYAIEATRRRQIDNASKDWQYDNDLFIIDLKRGTGAGTLAVNTGATQTDGTLIDPVTIYNARLSPARMAMRHFADMTVAVPSIYGRILKFSASEGYATAKMKSEGNYVIEKNAIVENQDISESDFADAGSLLLDVSPELMTFKYPIKPYEFRHIKEHPYGLVDADGILGWIRELEWDTGRETANFTLILKKRRS